MTVVPDGHGMTLICDACGDTSAGTPCVLPDAEVVWTLVAEHGWSGSPFATGPHRCPRCNLIPPGDPDVTGSPDDYALGVDDLDDVGDEGGHDGTLQAALAAAVEVDGRVIVDLSGVDHIDSAGLGLLVRARQDARQRGAALCLAAPSRFILTVLHTMRLDEAFPIVSTGKRALAGATARSGSGGST